MSAYWVPVLMNSAHKVIVPDYLSIYYKRHADGDPACLRESAKGCLGIPPGFRVVSGYDMKRMGQAQLENASYHFRCMAGAQTHRATLAEGGHRLWRGRPDQGRYQLRQLLERPA